MARLQFRHYPTVFNNRSEAIAYLNDLVDSQKRLSEKFVESLIGEPIVVNYKDDDDKTQLILAIGVAGNKGEGTLAEYHIIDSAKYEEDIAALDADTEELKQTVATLLSDLDNLSEKVDNIEEDVEDLKETYIKGVEINNRRETDWEGDHHSGIVAEVVDNVAYFDNLSTDNIKISDGYEGQLVHHDHSLTEFVASVEGIQLETITTGLETNVREAYKLVDGEGHQLGTEIVKIYKDSSLYRVYLGHVDDTLEDYTRPDVVDGTGDAALCFIYQKADGLYQLVTVNVEAFLEESEFADGLEVNNHVVSVKIDNTSEDFLSVGANGVKVSGIQEAIDDAVSTEEDRATDVEEAIQGELDTTQTGAGLANDGSYIHDHNTNYIGEATSLANADHILDTAVNDLETTVNNMEDRLDGEISDIKDDIDSLDADIVDEKNRATAKENALQEELNVTQTGAGLDNDGSYIHDHNANYIDEATSLADADHILDVAVKNVEDKVNELSAVTGNALAEINNNISDISEDLADEIERATNKEAEIDAEVDGLAEFIDNLSASTQAIEERVNISEEEISSISDKVDALEAKSIVGSKSIQVSGETEQVVSLLIYENEKILSQSDSGIKTTLNVDILRENDKDYIVLKGINDEEVSRVDATTFIKDGMLDSVDWIEDTNILEFVFNTDAGKETIRIDFSQFVNDEINRQIDELKEAIDILNGDITVPGSIDHTIDDRLVKYAVAGSAVEANGTLIRYYEDATGHKYYVSNKAEDMTYSGQSLANIITELINTSSSGRIDDLERALNNEIRNRQDADNDLEDAIEDEAQDRADADELLQGQIDEFENALSAETVARIDADEALQGQIDEFEDALSAETVARISADEELQGKIDDLEDALSAETVARIAADEELKEELISDAEYVSSAHTILFTNLDGEIVATIDATDFIKDGMIDDVVISGGSLIITFNTDSGKEDIEIPLTDIFNPDNYYTKEDVDDNFVSYEYLQLKEKVISAALNDLNKKIVEISGSTIDLSDYAKKDWVLSQGYITSGDVETIIDSKDYITSGDVKTQIESYNYVTSGDVKIQIEEYNYITSADAKTQIEEYNYVTSADVKTQVEEYNYITSADAKTQIEEYNYVTSADVKTQIEEYNYITSGDAKTQIESYSYVTSGDVSEQIESALTDYVNVETWEQDELTIAAAFNDLNNRVNEISGNTVDLSNYYTKDETYNKNEIDAKVASGGTFDPTQYYNKTQVDNLISGFTTTGDVKTQIESYHYITSGDAGDKNVIEAVKLNGTALTPDVNKAVDVTGVPTMSNSSITDFKIWFGNKSAYQAITPKDSHTFYIITSGTTA